MNYHVTDDVIQEKEEKNTGSTPRKRQRKTIQPPHKEVALQRVVVVLTHTVLLQ